MQARPFTAVDSLLGQPEVPTRAPSDLDYHERPLRPGVQRDEIEFRTTNPNVPAQNQPALALEVVRSEAFGSVAG